ncbi:MAG: hypothetical protein NC388_00590 [Clostridium sp.]|nr:hypothetical protein [Clostridium sp.]
MKKFVLYSSLAAAVMCVACDPVENTFHRTAIYHPFNGASVLYADQTRDSLSFLSFDSYTITVNSDWLHANESDLKGEVPAGAYVEGSIYFTVDPNTTGKTRDCSVVLNSYGYDFQAYYRQLPYLRVIRPSMNTEGEYSRTVKFDAEKDSLVFHPHGNWTLAIDGEKPEWMEWQEGTSMSGVAGEHKAVFTLRKNTTLDSRRVKFILTSNGVSTGMTLVQEKQKD